MNTVFLEKICRCCLNESEDMTNLFDRITGIELFTFEQHFTYSDLIYLCTNVRCDLDVVDANEHIVELPRNVCEQCLHELRAAFIFRQKCESSEQLLREQTVGISNVTEETVGFEQTGDGKNSEYLHEISVLRSNVKEIAPNEQCIIINEAKPVLIAINEHSSNENIKNDVEVQKVPVAPSDDEHLTNESKRHGTDPTHDDTCRATHLHDIKCTPDLDLEAHIHWQHHNKKHKYTESSKKIHTEKGFLSHKDSHNDQTVKRKFLCSICGKLFATRQRLKMHAAIHSGEKNHKKSHQCHECDKKFATESRLRCHNRTHTGEKPYRCDQCDLTFAQGNALRCHKRIHSGERPYKCRYCDKCFTQNTILKTHMTLHTGKTVKCPDCDKLFSRASNLILHRREHTGEKPYRCSQCSNSYKQKSHLDRHMDTHMGVKHTCDVCQKVYSKRWSLKVHMFTHSKVKPHRCSICGAEFTRRDKYRNHAKSIHGLTIVDNQNASTVAVNLNVENESTSK